jgi:hypothetical protein
MPRRNRNPGAGKPSHNGPARGGCRSGSGWGGPAQGAHEHRPLGGADDEYAQEVRRRARDEGVMARKEEVLAILRLKMLDIAFEGDGHAVQLAAADKLADRLEGKPVQKTQLSNPDGGPLIVERVLVEPAARQDAESL